MSWLNNFDLGIFQTAFPTMAMVGWLAWHLNGKFSKIDKEINKLLDAHELKDQTRHEANLFRFERISVALAKLGSDNGQYVSEKDQEGRRVN